MNIALIGYGLMGKEIEAVLKERGHTVIGPFTREYFDVNKLKKADAAIEFSVPEAAFQNLEKCLNASVSVVSGTTGWLKRYDEIAALAEKKETGFLYASNFSLGVNLFFALNKQLAALMQNYARYTVEMEEIHHTQKLDAPSGTAITLAEQILEKQTNLSDWFLKDDANANQNDKLPIIAKRIPDVPGTHAITYTSEIDSIEIKHTAHNRKGFALGAVLAAEYIADKNGVFTMQDVLNLQSN